MISNRVQGLRLLHGFAQIAAALLLFWTWALVMFGVIRSEGFEMRRYLVYSGVIAAAILLDFSRSKLLRSRILHLDVLLNHRLSLRQTVTVLICLLVFLVAEKDLIISRAFLLTLLPLLYLVFFFTNRWLPPILARRVFRDWHSAHTVLLGRAEEAESLRPWLDRKASYGIQTVGRVGDAQEGDAPDWLPYLGPTDKLAEILANTRATQLLAMDVPGDPARIIQISDLCDKMGTRLLIVNNLTEKIQRPVSLFEDDGLDLIGFRVEPLESPFARAQKRCIDLSIAVPVVVFLLPVVSAAVWLCHRLQSPGPLLFRQKRTGMHNDEFLIYKYRTMHPNHGDESIQVSENDGRVFPSGRWMRKLSIDELPQFINVFRGEMTIVGPRPHLVDHDRLFGEIANFYRVRSLIKPGITGLAQVQGFRGKMHHPKDITDRILSDIYYLEHWSPTMDLIIIAKTFRQVFFPPKSAH